MTLLFAIRTPLSPPENHIDQYRYASIRSRDTLSPPRQLLPVFHVKHVRTRTCLLLVSSLLRLSSGRNTGWLFVIGGQANEGVWRSIGVHGVASNPASTPRTRSDLWFHVKPRSYSSDAPFSL